MESKKCLADSLNAVETSLDLEVPLQQSTRIKKPSPAEEVRAVAADVCGGPVDTRGCLPKDVELGGLSSTPVEAANKVTMVIDGEGPTQTAGETARVNPNAEVGVQTSTDFHTAGTVTMVNDGEGPTPATTEAAEVNADVGGPSSKAFHTAGPS